jgi:hypothetical protein
MANGGRWTLYKNEQIEVKTRAAFVHYDHARFAQFVGLILFIVGRSVGHCLTMLAYSLQLTNMRSVGHILLKRR